MSKPPVWAEIYEGGVRLTAGGGREKVGRVVKVPVQSVARRSEVSTAVRLPWAWYRHSS